MEDKKMNGDERNARLMSDKGPTGESDLVFAIKAVFFLLATILLAAGTKWFFSLILDFMGAAP